MHVYVYIYCSNFAHWKSCWKSETVRERNEGKKYICIMFITLVNSSDCCSRLRIICRIPWFICGHYATQLPEVEHCFRGPTSSFCQMTARKTAQPNTTFVNRWELVIGNTVQMPFAQFKSGVQWSPEFATEPKAGLVGSHSASHTQWCKEGFGLTEWLVGTGQRNLAVFFWQNSCHLKTHGFPDRVAYVVSMAPSYSRLTIKVAVVPSFATWGRAAWYTALLFMYSEDQRKTKILFRFNNREYLMSGCERKLQRLADQFSQMLSHHPI